MTNHPNELPGNDTPLDSWKEIAAYLQRDVSTAMRWEKSEELPVHRHQHSSRASVYAFTSELDAWKAARKPQSGESRPWRRWVPALAGGLALLAVAAFIQWGPILHPPDPLAAAADIGGGVRLRQVWTEGEVDTSGSISPDGRYLSYVHWDTGDLALRDLETGENRLLTNKGPWGESDEFAHYSVFAPDSKRFCYIWWDAKTSVYELRILDVTAADPEATVRTLYRHEEVEWPTPYAWLPDGEKVLAVLDRKDKSSTMALLSVEDGSVTALKSFDWSGVGRALVSPNGRFIAYNGPPDGDAEQHDIYLLAADGSLQTRLVEHPSHDDVIAWSPSGRSLVFRSDRGGTEDLWVIGVENGKPSGAARLLRANFALVRPVGVGPDQALYYGVRTDDHNVYVAAVDFETGERLEAPRVAIQSYVGKNTWPSWSPDGRALAYLSRRNRDHNGALRPTLVVQPMPTGKPRGYELGFARMGRPAWSPDGNRLVFGAKHKNRDGLYLFDLETREAKFAVEAAGWKHQRAFWHASGRRIYHQGWDEDQQTLFSATYDLQSGTRERLFEAKFADAVPSPDGRAFAVRDHDRKSGISRLLLRDAATGETRRLHEVRKPEEIGTFPAWTPDGRRIAFWKVNSQSGAGTLWSVRKDGSGLCQTKIKVKSVHSRDLSIHPDGQQVAYSAGKSRYEIWALENFLPQAASETK